MSDSEQHGTCEYVGEGMADMTGIGIMVGFVGQALLSLILSFLVFSLTKHGRLDLRGEKGSVEWKVQQKRLTFVCDILMIGNDIQMALGISYMITVFTQARTIDLYHLRFVFDVVSFVGVSSTAALVCWSFCAIQLPEIKRKKLPTRDTFWTRRHRVTHLFVAMFIALTIMLLVQLSELNVNTEPGRCYHANWTTKSNSSHPAADQVYVGMSAAWVVVTTGTAIKIGAKHRRWILTSTFLQFPVHLCMSIALRTENQGKLSGEETNENSWDFSQTTVVILLLLAIMELFRKGREFLSFEWALRRGKHETEEDKDVELQTRSNPFRDESLEREFLNRGPWSR